MIDQDLINRNANILQAIAEGRVESESVASELVELLNETDSNYVHLTEQNAALHMEIAKLKGDRVFVVNDSHDDMQVNNIVDWSCKAHK